MHLRSFLRAARTRGAAPQTATRAALSVSSSRRGLMMGGAPRRLLSTSQALRSKSAAPSMSAINEAVEVIDHDQGANALPATGILLTCEHASNRLPAPYTWPAADAARRLPEDHWAYDPGSEAFTRELRSALNAAAVLSRYSRLLIDPNRPMSSDTLIRTVADNQPIELNAAVDAHETTKRVNRFYLPYHSALNALITRRPSVYHTVLSLHSYTPSYEGNKRDVQIGVLFKTPDAADPAPPLAAAFRDAFVRGGHDARFNEPWSGQRGFMYAADKLTLAGVAPTTATPPANDGYPETIAAAVPARRAVMIEFRNDLLTQPKWRAAVVAQCVEALRAQNLLTPAKL